MFIEFVKKLDLPNRYTHTYTHTHTQFGGLCRSLAGKVRSCPFILVCGMLWHVVAWVWVGVCAGLHVSICGQFILANWIVNNLWTDVVRYLWAGTVVLVCMYVCSSDKMHSFLVDFMQESRLNSCYTWCIVENFAWEHFVQFTDWLWLTKIFTAKVFDCQATWFTVNLSTRFTVHGSTSVVRHSC